MMSSLNFLYVGFCCYVTISLYCLSLSMGRMWTDIQIEQCGLTDFSCAEQNNLIINNLKNDYLVLEKHLHAVQKQHRVAQEQLQTSEALLHYLQQELRSQKVVHLLHRFKIIVYKLFY